MIGGTFADISAPLPSEWTSSTAELRVVDAVPCLADSRIENARELRGNIVLVSRDTDEVTRSRGAVPFWKTVQHAAEAGAVGVIIVNILPVTSPASSASFNCEIPVLVITPSDATRLRDKGTFLRPVSGSKLN